MILRLIHDFRRRCVTTLVRRMAAMLCRGGRRSLSTRFQPDFHPISTRFPPHFNPISTPFQPHFNPISTPFQPQSLPPSLPVAFLFLHVSSFELQFESDMHESMIASRSLHPPGRRMGLSPQLQKCVNKDQDMASMVRKMEAMMANPMPYVQR